jgi:hypothetical protein
VWVGGWCGWVGGVGGWVVWVGGWVGGWGCGCGGGGGGEVQKGLSGLRCRVSVGCIDVGPIPSHSPHLGSGHACRQRKPLTSTVMAQPHTHLRGEPGAPPIVLSCVMLPPHTPTNTTALSKPDAMLLSFINQAMNEEAVLHRAHGGGASRSTNRGAGNSRKRHNNKVGQ